MSTGKDYKKGDPVRGAAVLVLSMELSGHDPKAVDVLVKDTLADLGVKRKQVDRYIRKHREELVELLEKQGIK